MDIIAAIATGQAATAIGIVRISGEGCFALCDQVFRPMNGRPFSQTEPRKMIYGDVLDQSGGVLDRGLAVRFPGTGSYTGEDSAEFHCHGSPVVLREVLNTLFALGARQARPGEFTRRAFLNGRMDLTQAEAVIDLIDAETAAAAKNAMAQLDGALVDYPDEDIEDIRPEQIRETLAETESALERLLATGQRGKVLKAGVRTAIVGRPNAGKSSLLNALAGYERAIVTDIPGTTRDTVEESAVVRDVLLRLVDTAGIRDSADAVEQLGVERSRRAVDSAQLVIAVIDGVTGPTEEDQEILELASRAPHWILGFSKSDLLPQGSCPVLEIPGSLREPDQAVSFSSVAPDGLRLLEDAIADLFPAGDPKDAGGLLTDIRQEDAVRRTLEAVRRAREALSAGLTPDAVVTDIEDGLNALGELTGRTAREDIVERIFSRFCVGK